MSNLLSEKHFFYYKTSGQLQKKKNTHQYKTISLHLGYIHIHSKTKIIYLKYERMEALSVQFFKMDR